MQIHAHTPDRWGEGLLFGYSGLDGPTDSATGFVASVGQDGASFLIHTPRKRVVSLDGFVPDNVHVAAHDILWAGEEHTPVGVTWHAWHTMIGMIPDSVVPRIGFVDEALCACDGVPVITTDDKHGNAVVLLSRAGRFCIAYGATVDEARGRAEVGMQVAVDEVIRKRLTRYSGLPDLGDARANRLLGKCLSVMAVNTLAPEGVFNCRWSTPDRVPHRRMWLWDSVFHSFQMNQYDPTLAWECVRVVLDRAWPRGEEAPEKAGMISHCMEVNGARSGITQPPLLAWGVLETIRAGGVDTDALRTYAPVLGDYLQWNLDHRDQAGTGLLQWVIEGNPLCRSGESGLDNSPRFDSASQMDAVDFVVFQVHDMQCLAEIYTHLGEEERSAMWRKRADELEARLHAVCWSDEAGLYLDRMPDGTLSPVRAVTGFLPLLLDGSPPERVEAMRATLQSPAFQTAFPVPSVATDDETFSTDMWRGSTWINTNYLIVLGLERHGLHAEASRLREETIQLVQSWYEKTGVVYEFYDATGTRPPSMCDRKGPPDGKPYLLGKMGCIRDYHWTASLTACLLLGRNME